MADEDIKLTERETLVAKEAARLAVKGMQDEFYKTVGRSVINKALIVVGGLAVIFALYIDRWIKGAS